MVFVAGLFISALGVAVTKKGELGVSPISSVANVVSMRFPVLTLGTCLIIWNCILILGQIAVLGKDFRLFQLLQIPLSFLFGLFTDAGVSLCSLFTVSSYLGRCICVVLGTVILGLGISLTVRADMIMNSGEAFVKAVSGRFGKRFSGTKVIFDVGCVVLAVVLSLILFRGRIVGVREGTVFAAAATGFCVKFFMHLANRFSVR